MKKLFYIFLLSFLLFLPTDVNAEEIDCDSNPYACIQCTYKIGMGSDEVTFQVWSDGVKTQISESYNFTPGENYKPTVESNIISKNFEIDSDNKLKCPDTMYYAARQSGYSGIYTISFDLNWLEDNYNRYYVSELLNSYNNDKEIYESDSDMLSCTYDNNITIKSDGEILVVENRSGNLFSIVSNNNHTYTIENNTTEVLENFSGDISASDFLDENGNLRESCPTYYIRCVDLYNSCSIMSEQGPSSSEVQGEESLNGETIQSTRDLIEGRTYLNLLGALKNPLVIGNKNFSSLRLNINGNVNATLNAVDANNDLCQGNECLVNNEYYIEQGLKNIVQYCNVLYNNYSTYKNEEEKLSLRMDECISFNEFYENGVNNGVFFDYRNDCPILSDEIIDKLKYFLDLIKIVGPLLALGLGTLDFVRTVVSGDADKEMKNTFKRFSTRLIAAALLFLIPVILAFLMDMFLGNQDGYDSDNPFCDVVDWGNL